MTSPAEHWDDAYGRVGENGGSWFQAAPTTSLELLGESGACSLLDAGGGASTLVDHLLDRGWRDLTVLDISHDALALSRARLGADASLVTWVEHDVLTWESRRTFEVWHDRAVFHFLVDPGQRQRYLDVLATATGPGSRLIVGTFAEDGPPACSGLPVARYDVPALTAAVGPLWRARRTRRELHRTPGGDTQPFTWAEFTGE